METVSGVSNWKLVIRREEQAVCILRGVTCDERAVLPEELFGLPVTELGGHALSPTAPARADGEEVLVSCGLTGGEAQWDNRRLTDLTLPAALRKVGVREHAQDIPLLVDHFIRTAISRPFASTTV